MKVLPCSLPLLFALFMACGAPSEPGKGSVSDSAELPFVAPYEDWSSEEGPFPIEGFGAATLGGWREGADEVVVSSLEDDGPGTLREALRTKGPRVIRFGVDGEIRLSSSILVPSEVTIDGRGHEVVLVGKGLILAGTDDVILTHLTLSDVQGLGEDGLRIGDPTLGPSERVVLDHLGFLQHDGGGDSTRVDEAISVIYGSREITLQWCRFEAWEKVLLFGNGDADPAVDAEISVSVHHSWALGTGRRHPQARHGQFDFWNNVWEDWHMFGLYLEPPWRDSFGMLCEDDCRMLAEQNGFSRVEIEEDLLSRANLATLCDTGGVMEERGSYVSPESTAPLIFGDGCPEEAFAFDRVYEAVIDDSGPEMWEKVTRWAGAEGGR